MTRKSLRHGAAWALSPLLLACALAWADPVYEFDIRGETLAGALKEFARQSGLQIAYFTRVAEGRSAPTVSGALTAEEALRILLSTSGLTFERIDGETIAIHDADSLAARRKTNSRAPSRSLRLASAQSTDAADSEGGAMTAAELRAASLDEVIVTGTNIRGVPNDTAPRMTYDRRYIERSGFTNMMDLVESLPINFKGGASGATEMAPFGQANNYGQNLTRGTGFNLRGLGSVSTLTLINGRRVAPSAQGSFVDISTIPLSAVERIEILTDGASAIYGADAVAGVVNIILRRQFDGAETGLQYGSDAEGSVSEQRVSQTVGQNWGSGNALLVGELYGRDPLDVTDRDYIVRAGAIGPTHLLPRRQLGTMLLAFDQQLTERMDLSGNALYSYEEVSMKDTDSTGETFGKQSPLTNKWSATAGIGYDAFADWRVAIDATAAKVETQSGFHYQSVPTGEDLLLIRDYHDRFKTWSLEAKADGSLFEWSAGVVRLAIGGSYREDEVHSTRMRVIPVTRFEIRALDSRQVASAFAELYVPLIGAQQSIPWAERVDLSLAARYDDYSDFGSTTNPKIGIVWTPVAGLDLRAAYSTSFRAPTVSEKALGARGVQLSTELIESADGRSQVPVFSLIGSVPLVAEQSENLAIGFTLKPVALPDTELSVNYFRIDYTDRISVPPYDNGLLSRRDEYGDLITDIADDAAAQAYLDQRLAQDDLYIDFVGTGAAGVRYLLDFRQQNAARTQLSGFDVTLTQAWRHGADTFSADLNVMHLNKLLTSLTRDTTTFDQIDRYNQPLDWRARAMGTWTRGGLSSTVVVNYSDDYINDSLLEDVPISSWTTVDLNLSYDFGTAPRLAFLASTRVSLGIDNLFDRDPPRADAPVFQPQVGFDVFNADPLGRFITARLSKRW